MNKKVIRIALLCIAIVLAIYGIAKMMGYEVNNFQISASNLKAENIKNTVASKLMESTGKLKNTNTGTWECTTRTNDSLGVPTFGNYQIYCIEHKVSVFFEWDLRKNAAQRIINSANNNSTSEHGCVSRPNEGDRIPTEYIPGNTYSLSPAEAYIVSNGTSWTAEKQQAIWDIRSGSGGSRLATEARNYANFDSKVRDKGLQPEDKTNKDKVYTKVQQAKETKYTVGPFNVKYTQGTYGNVTFGGISEITVVGYDSEGKSVKEDIKVKQIILEDKVTGIYGTAKEPKYFTANKGNLYVDRNEQIYPASEQNFQVVFELSEEETKQISSIGLKVKFRYMLSEGKYTYLTGKKGTIRYQHTDTAHTHTYQRWMGYDDDGEDIWEPVTYPCHSCEIKGYISYDDAPQDTMSADAIRSLYEQEIYVSSKDKSIPITMNLGGKVWEEVGAGKESTTDGKYTEIDRVVPNVKVTLYEENGTIANLLSNPDDEKISNDINKIRHRINPTYTDDNGEYLFEGLDASKKYYVKFEYNGQTYLPTDYLKYGSGYSTVNAVINTKVDADKYNTANWNNSSKGTETVSDRNNYDNKFANIGSAPLNYKSSNSLNSGKLVNGYNEAFSQYELMGFVLGENGSYTKNNNLALIDGFYKVENGNIVETNQLQEGRISKAIKKYIIDYKKSPNIKDIYNEIAKNDETLWKKLQFIEDCKIASYTQGQGQQKDLYPVYPEFIINTPNSAGEYDTGIKTFDNVPYKPIYPGQLHVNQGLWRRQEVDLALRKDIAYAATKINGKTEVYKYDKRGSNDDYWQIQLRMRDYNNYYGANYTREVYKADYAYRSANTNGVTGKNLELYVTYKITVRNNSESINAKVNEIVDYYDKDYEYKEELSWYENNQPKNAKDKAEFDKQYYNLMSKDKPAVDFNTIKQKMTYNKDKNGVYHSKYGEASEQRTIYNGNTNMETEYQSVYIGGIDKLLTNEDQEVYIYLTFKVKENKEGIILDDGTHGNDEKLKQNYAEINGYSTYYDTNTELPNNQTKSPKKQKEKDIAGLIDFNSNPGNLSYNDIQGYKAEKNFENDTDRAKSIKVTLDTTSTRSINGTVWEDKRTQQAGEAIIGNGVRDNGETTVKGVTVELVEKLSNGEKVWQITESGTGKGRRINLTTGKEEEYTYNVPNGNNGYYEFSESIPGNYIVRFKYGHNEATVKPNESQNVSYNGQDFKSTVYQQGLGNYTDTEYNIQASDAAGKNLSDAMDIWARREEVNKYSIGQITNEKAEILASPYANPIDNNRIKTLIDNTNMIAETKLIVLDGEYNRTSTDGEKESNGSNIYLNGNDVNGNYTLNNVDFGLVERPKAQLELGKKVTNVKVTLANGSTLFDAVKGTKDLAWTPGTEYALNKQNSIKTGNIYKEHYSYRPTITDNGLITVTMDDELMHGATIQISYELTVTNVGEVDYTGQNFYYKGTGATEANKVKTKADIVLDYVSNNLQYREKDNNGWSVIKPEGENTVVKQAKLDEKLAENVKKFNTVLQTAELSKDLKPGEKDTTKLVLTQLMTAQNTDDDRAYNNIAEITTISNSVGRRMAFSVQGNQDPTATPAEVDSAKSEQVLVLPPFGIGNMIVYITIAIVTLAILSGGIILIKKKVLKK